jgi:hypothetical protein
MRSVGSPTITVSNLIHPNPVSSLNKYVPAHTLLNVSPVLITVVVSGNTNHSKGSQEKHVYDATTSPSQSPKQFASVTDVLMVGVNKSLTVAVSAPEHPSSSVTVT